MSVVAVVQARTGSARLPGKVLLPLAGAPALQRMLERTMRAALVDRVVVATSTEPRDNGVDALCRTMGVACIRGSERDVLARFARVAETAAADASHLVRLTADCPLVDPALVDAVVGAAVEQGNDYTANTDPPSWPDGLDVEVMTRAILLEAHVHATLPSDREHVTPWIRRSAGRCMTAAAPSTEDLSSHRWTLDEPEDYVLLAAVYAGLYRQESHFDTAEILSYLRSRPEIAAINARFARNEGYAASLQLDPVEGADDVTC